MLSSTFFLSSALNEEGGQRLDPTDFTPAMTRYPLYRKLGVPQGRSRRVRKIFFPRDSIAGPCSPCRVVILTTLSRPPCMDTGTE